MQHLPDDDLVHVGDGEGEQARGREGQCHLEHGAHPAALDADPHGPGENAMNSAAETRLPAIRPTAKPIRPWPVATRPMVTATPIQLLTC